MTTNTTNTTNTIEEMPSDVLSDTIIADEIEVTEYYEVLDEISTDVANAEAIAETSYEKMNESKESVDSAKEELSTYDTATNSILTEANTTESSYIDTLEGLSAERKEVGTIGEVIIGSDLWDSDAVYEAYGDIWYEVFVANRLVDIDKQSLEEGAYVEDDFTNKHSYAEAATNLDAAIPRADAVTEQLKEEGYSEDLVNLWTDYVDSVKQYRQQLEALKDVKVYETCDKINDMKAEVDSRNNSDERAALVWNVESAQEAYEQAKAEYDDLSAQLDAKLAELEELKAREPEIEALKVEIAEMKAELEARIKQAEEEAQKKAEEANNKVEEEVNEKVEEVTKTDELPKTDIIEQVVEGTVETIPTEPVKTVEVQKAEPVVSVPTGVETSIGGAMTGLMMSVAMLSSMVAYKLKHH